MLYTLRIQWGYPERILEETATVEQQTLHYTTVKFDQIQFDQISFQGMFKSCISKP